MNRAYNHCTKVLNSPQGVQAFFDDLLLRRLRISYRRTTSYNSAYSTYSNCRSISNINNPLHIHFQEWLKVVVIEDLESEFNEHEIIELLSHEEPN